MLLSKIIKEEKMKEPEEVIIKNNNLLYIIYG